VSDTGRELYEQEVVRRILALREDLIRHDSNAAALALMEDCVPYFVADHPAIVEARERTWRQSGHVRNPAMYADYYATNANERPFEEQYGLPVEEAHRLPRVAFLRGQLSAMHHELQRPLRVLDMAGNDGAIAANLASLPFEVTCDLVDLNPGNCDLARDRARDYATIGWVWEGDVCDVGPWDDRVYDAVVAFELIEHVADPQMLLAAMVACVKPGGYLFVSTPSGVDHGGDLPGWDDDQPKGHVRVYGEASFRAELEKVGTVDRFLTGPDGVMAAQVKPA
jgi:2-polyprenyl-3-methyl-5-hydroxy-6-metoxy-1,4-benzoquinol methylase